MHGKRFEGVLTECAQNVGDAGGGKVARSMRGGAWRPAGSGAFTATWGTPGVIRMPIAIGAILKAT